MPSTPPRFEALIDLLLTVGYIDGIFDHHEKAYVGRYLDQLIAHLEVPPGSFDAVYARLETEIAALAAEVVELGDAGFVRNRLKVRAVALFRGFPPVDQAVALEVIAGLVKADGTISPIERHLHEELLAHFHASPATLPAPPASPGPLDLLRIDPPRTLELATFTHALLDPLERPYAEDALVRGAQVGDDYELIFKAIMTWERQRARANGRLVGITDVGQLPVGTRLLDGHVHVLRPEHPTELVVLGDLHGCYACLKAALLQSNFIARAHAYQHDPGNHPDIKLVLLGDYLDRGRFGFEGVLRAALQLLVSLPNHVIMLRGNHELLIRRGGRVVSAVNPAEAVPAIADRVSPDILEAYRHLFDHMPTSFLFDRTLFVHGGIPRDDTFADRYRDLSSLDDADLRFQMMWSDPIDGDHVPVDLQRESARFSFGRDQFRAFMERVGCHTMIRGHEQVDAGFRTVFDVGQRRLHTLFSAGGHDNPDLPSTSRYRNITPMGLTIRRELDALYGYTWPLAYQPFGTGTHNGLYREHVA
ncbi:MAG: metallophosphoesterase [Proteobacteria bacterium]|nr:metallophosphoesterase [Pseudomonadota bacterium]